MMSASRNYGALESHPELHSEKVTLRYELRSGTDAPASPLSIVMTRSLDPKSRKAQWFVELISEQAGYRMGVQITPSWIIRALGLVNPTMRAVADMLRSEAPG